MNIYLVGGAVRDELLGLPVKEKDWVVVGSTPEKMQALGFQQVGKDFPVFLHPETHEEYALARTERKTGRGYTQFTCYAAPDVTLEDDLKRRDLTINAMAKALDGTLIDPYGGQKDLENKLLRHISETFVEDPVRILRIARFASRYAYLGFTIADETMELLSQMVNAGEVDALVAERVWQELDSTLHEKNPEIFFTVLRNCGALKILFPELDQLFGVPNPVKWHPEVDTGIHTLLVLKAACRLSEDPEVRFAALLHDVGKGLTPKDQWPSHKGHEIAGVTLIKALCNRYKIPKNYMDLALLVGKYHGLCHKALELKPSTLVKLLKKLDALRKPKRFHQFLIACAADFHGRPGYENLPYPQATCLQQVFEIMRQVPVKPLIEMGFTSAKLGDALYQAQVSAVKKMQKLYTPPSGLPLPSVEAISYAYPLINTIIEAMKENHGKISFEKFMHLALYAPGLGYYSAGSRKIGVAGDFITAPEISHLFSYAIAKQCEEIFKRLDNSNILEFGAGSGTMAVDILTYLSHQNALPKYYFILETSADLKQRQRETFETHAPHLLSHVQWLDTLPTNFKGVMLANEVLDAFPVHRFLLTHNDVQEYYVGWKNDAFTWVLDKPSSPELMNEALKIKQEHLPHAEHYTSELNLRASAWLHALSESLTAGAILLIDYGFPREVYYHPERSEGTLMCHYRHHAQTNPLILVGLQDITAHVDFSFIAECAIKVGLTVAEYTTQANFLLHSGILNQLESQTDLLKRLKISRQIQTLMMPHEMGELFKVMLLSKAP